MNRALSQKFRFFTFISICLLSYVHGYNLKETYLAPYSTVEESLSFTSFFEYLFANGLLRFRIPLLFIISGYLFALFDSRSYIESIKKRVKTLMIPYLLWSAIALLFTFSLQQFKGSAAIVAQSGIDQMGDNRPYSEIGWNGIFFRWIFTPIAFQLWFIMALFIYNLIYPFIRWVLQKVPIIWLSFTFLIWFFPIQFFIFDGQGLFFFSVGVLAQKKGIFLEKRPQWLSTGIFFILFVGISVIKTFMAFELEPNVIITHLTLTILHRIAILCGMVAIWYGIDPIIKYTINQKWFLHISKHSFFIFALHVPMLPYLMTYALNITSNFWLNRITCYLLIPLLVIAISIAVGELIRKSVPKIYSVLTGGRGY